MLSLLFTSSLFISNLPALNDQVPLDTSFPQELLRALPKYVLAISCLVAAGYTISEMLSYLGHGYLEAKAVKLKYEEELRNDDGDQILTDREISAAGTVQAISTSFKIFYREILATMAAGALVYGGYKLLRR